MTDVTRPSAHDRRGHILELLGRAPFVRVADLSDRFGVSEVTVRADLETLAAEGLVHRVRGGAVPLPRPRREPTYVESLGVHAAEKEAVGAAAAALVQPGESLFLDVGTTNLAIARALVARADLEDVVVVTNALPTALELEAAVPRFSVIVTGGTLRPQQHSLVEPLASVLIQEHLYIDTAFIGCTGVTVARGVTNVNLAEAEVKRRVIAVARRSIVVADGTKVGAVALAPVCPIAAVDLLVTSATAPAGALDDLEANGLAVDVIAVAD